MSLSQEMLALTPKLRACAWMLTNGCDPDDLVQETLLRAWRFRHTFRPGSNLQAWMFHILRNVHFADAGRRGRTVADVDGRFTRRLAQEADQEAALRFAELLEALDELPALSREALILVAGSGFGYEEAAAACGCAVGTFKSRLNRARQQLAARLASEAAPVRQGMTDGAVGRGSPAP